MRVSCLYVWGLGESDSVPSGEFMVAMFRGMRPARSPVLLEVKRGTGGRLWC